MHGFTIWILKKLCVTTKNNSSTRICHEKEYIYINHKSIDSSWKPKDRKQHFFGSWNVNVETLSPTTCWNFTQEDEFSVTSKNFSYIWTTKP
jgi:hypothetical protein